MAIAHTGRVPANPEAEKPEASAPELHERGRGRRAEKPTDVPAKGWLDILARTKQQISEDNLPIVAAGVAFYGFVALVPALAATVSIYGLMLDAASIGKHIEAMATVVPNEVLPLLREQITRIASNEAAAGIGALIGIALAIYSSMKATKAMITGLNIAYDEEEERGFFKLLLVALVLTLGAIVAAVLAIALVAVLPSVLDRLHITSGTENLLNILRWPLLIGGFMTALAALYRFGPSRHDAKWRWVSPGAIAATVLWVLASAAFSFYVARFASYDKTYGPLGTVVIFMMWLFITAQVVLLGAELNAELERQTVKDTTEGTPKPLGQRGATAADTVGPSRENLREEKKK